MARRGGNPGGGERTARVGERVRQELASLLLRGAVKDPRVAGTVVQAVRMTPDLREARVYVRTQSEVDEAGQRRVLAGLGRASGFLRREVGQVVKLRHTPELVFHWDDTPEEAARVEALLASLREEPGRPAGEDEE